MDHSEASGLFDAYFANLLDRAKVKAFHAHINDCEDCKLRLRAMRAGAEMGKKWSVRGGGRYGMEDGRAGKMQEILFKNRVITYAIVAVMVAFFLMFILRR